MTTGKRRRSPWAALAVSLGAVLGEGSHAQPAPPDLLDSGTQPSAATPGDENLYLEVEINRLSTRQIAHFVLRGGRLHATVSTLQALGLTWPAATQGGVGLVPLDSLPGLRSDYDVADQRLRLMVPVSLLGGAPAEVGYEVPPLPRLDPSAQAPGLLLNYDLYAQDDEHSRNVSGWSELRLFGVGPGVLRNSHLMQSTTGVPGGDAYRGVRLDTTWQIDWPERMVSMTVGDAYTSALSWTRTLRFGGLRLSRNFSLQPYRVTVPLASFAGEAALPSVVDLYINGVRDAERHVDPGRFEMVSAPVLNGVGNAQMVVTDITGQRRVFNYALYNSARLLQKGLGDWSIETGRLRRSYGVRSFSYADEQMSSASGRFGVSNHLTLEAHAEASDDLSMAGVGSLLLLGRTAGVLSASYAASKQGPLQGQQHGAGYEWQGRSLSMQLSTLRRNDAFRDVASLEGATLPRRTDLAFLGMSLGRSQFGLSYVRQDYKDIPRASYAGLSWAHSTAGNGSISVGLNQDLDGDRGTNAFLYWSRPLGPRNHAWTSLEHHHLGNTLTAGALRSLPGDHNGWGWRVQANAGEEQGAQAEITQLTRFGQWRAGTQYWQHQGQGSTTMAYAGASGALLWMQGGLTPMRRVYDAFAMVSTDGIAGVPVMLENRLVGTTNDDGLLLVAPLNAWESNHLSIDPLVLPADVSVQRTRLAAVPATGSGMLAHFPMKALVVVELSLRGPAGKWIPAGTPVSLEPGGLRAMVGYDGRMYLENPPAGARLVVPLSTGRCTVDLPHTFPDRGRINLGEMSCH